MRNRLLALVATVLVAATSVSAKETVTFAYDAYAEFTSTYIWRGQYNGGLSFQPDLAVGFDSEHTSFRFGTWWSVGASDWGFRKNVIPTEEEEEEGINPNTYFVPETDIYLNADIWGLTIGGTKYHFYNNSNFAKDGLWEVSLGYNFGTLLNVPLTITGNVFVAGSDDQDDNGEQMYSTYLEVAYYHTWEKYGITFGGAMGMSLRGQYYADAATICNMSLRLDKTWNIADICEIGIFGVGSLNPDGINKDNALIWASGDNKVCCQKLNGAIGLSLAF